MMRRPFIAVLLLSSSLVVVTAATRPRRLAASLRGGSFEEEEEEEFADEEAIKARKWILEQIRLRQERLVLLSQSLAERGLPFSGLSSMSETMLKGMGGGAKIAHPPEWVCEMSTDADPKTCLIWGDAEPGTKVVRPANAPDQWCSLGALNGLRRRDPVKASRLWFDQYVVDMRRFSQDAGPAGVALAGFMDRPAMTRAATAVLCAFGIVILRLPIQFVLIFLLTSSLTWRQYALWSPIAHAPLPLKLVLIRQTYLTFQRYFSLLERAFVAALTDLESRLFEATAVLETEKTMTTSPSSSSDEEGEDEDDDT